MQYYIFLNFALIGVHFFFFNLIDVIVYLGFMMILVLKYSLIVFRSN